MSELYHRVLLWHKLVCQTTGGLALCSAKHKLNRGEATQWVKYLRDVADDIASYLENDTFILDNRGQRVLKSPSDASSGDGGTPTTAGLPRPQSAGRPRTLRRKP